MMKLVESEINSILKAEKEIYDGDRREAVAAHVYGALIVAKCAGVPPFADKSLVSNLKAQVTRYESSKKNS